ncbi:hypothetical protein [Campylobacter ureolyticus]|uniref:hypothetical protein n=1 Tax=Campylobacter ureolyticus TaxID=827 RepID=UPI0022B52048|nr:hypothetical protein [Campylobacter ureolyticus]MCZ6172962.1 hypothetical protein [Campylobacter ureolyticus]
MNEKYNTVHLSQSALNAINEEVRGSGGYQTLMRKLQKQLIGTELHYSDDYLEKIKRYAKEYNNGGYQNRFKEILKCIEKNK